jgi:hypothetical protein
MTIAISLKVNDGLILAADSASTLVTQDPAGNAGVVNVYNNANKVFNLRKGLPIGAITWGSGSIGTASIATLAKDLRKRFTDPDKTHREWKLVSNTYTVESVAQKLKQFMYDELYVPAFRDWPEQPALGFIVAGYSANADMAEEYIIEIQGGQCSGPSLVRQRNESGLVWNGQPEAISRLVIGYGTQLPDVLSNNLGVPPDQIEPVLNVLQQALQAPLVVPAMPIQDAIDLAKFLVDLTVNFSRFMPGAPTVGGPVEVAAITKHEGFKWIQRKHYFSKDLNPEGRV